MRAAIYCRLSREEQGSTGEAESIQNQRALLTGYARSHGYEVYRVYCDQNYSGMDRQRPAFNRMLADARAGRFELVLAKTQSRFTRDMELVEKYLHGLFAEWGVRFIAVVDHVDTQDKANKKARQINGLINEWYLEDLSGSVRAVLDQKRRDGQYIASAALYGYRKAPGCKNRLQPDPPAAAVVRQVFAMAYQGWGVRRIACALNAQGVPSPTAYRRQGRPPALPPAAAPLWGEATVWQMLHNETYTGSLVQGRSRRVSYKSRRTVRLPKQQWVVVAGTHPPLVSRSLYEAVQQSMAGRARPGAPGQLQPLARLVRCGVCGARLQQCGGGNGARYLRCRTHQRAPERCANNSCTNLAALQQLLLARLRQHAAGSLDAAALPLPPCPDAAAAQLPQLQAAAQKLAAQAQACRQAVRQLYLDRAQGLLPPGQFAALGGALEAEAEQAAAQLAALQRRLAALQSEDAAARGRRQEARRQRLCRLAQLEQLTRPLAVLLIRQVTVYPRQNGQQRVVVEWAF